VLQAPTGAGKTRAALDPFFVNLARSAADPSAMPRTCRYAVPLRTLATQFYNEYSGFKAKMSSNEEIKRLQKLYADVQVPFIAEQTGENPGDPQLEACLTFCTIDQLLAAFLGIPYGVSPRQANIKEAGVFGSYIVLDEWHLYPLRGSGKPGANDYSGARSTTLSMLRLLNEQKLARFCLMTATLSTHLAGRLAQMLGADLESLRQGARPGETEDEAFAREYAEIVGSRTRSFVRASSSLYDSVPGILESHRDATLVVCNQVERAQMLYLELMDAARRMGNAAPHIILLHSRFTTEDRRRITDLIQSELSKEAWEARGRGEKPPANLIVVGTQVVEVGLNISATRLHTELAPANALVQRAGRCARFDGQSGEVVVYPLPESNNPALPYSEEMCKATLEFLPTTPQQYGMVEEQKLLDHVHTAEDERFLDSFERNHVDRVKAIFTGWNWRIQNHINAAVELIRDVQQVPVLIHADPDNAIKEEPWLWHSFSLRPDTLMGRWNRLRELAQQFDLDWTIKKLEYQKVGTVGDEESDSRTPLECKWIPVVAESEIRSALMLVLPPELAHYDPSLGFVLRDPDRMLGLPPVADSSWQSALVARPKNKPRYGPIERQIYLVHISGLTRSYNYLISDELRWACTQLERALNYKPGTIEIVVRLALALHDLGKLTKRWQNWARAWQQLVYDSDSSSLSQRVNPSVLFAKTDFDSKRGHKELQKSVGRPPRHAVEGMAMARKALTRTVRTLVVATADDKARQDVLAQAVLTAIAHHHTSSATTFEDASLASGAIEVIKSALDHVGAATHIDIDRISRKTEEQRANWQCSMSEGERGQEGALLYFLIVRALRLSDQRADFNRDPELDRLQSEQP